MQNLHFTSVWEIRQISVSPGPAQDVCWCCWYQTFRSLSSLH